MNAYSKHEPLRKSKSMCSLNEDAVYKNHTLHKEHSFCSFGDRHSRTSESSEVYVVNDSDSECSVDEKVEIPALEMDGEISLSCLEQKIDRLSDLFLEQCRLLSSIKDEVQESRKTMEKSGYEHHQLLAEIIDNDVTQRMRELPECSNSDDKDNSPARSLLDAIEAKRSGSLDQDIRDALRAFLQSDELAARVASSTCASVRGVVRGCVSRDVAAVYLPVLERSQRRLLRHVTRTLEDAFAELEENSSQLSKQMFRASKNLRRSLERHLGLLDTPAHTRFANSLRRTVEELLDKELKQWRQKLLDVLTAELKPERAESPPPEYLSPVGPLSPPQPADPESSIIDQLMQTAEINHQLRGGDAEGSFTRALSAADLALVMAACRAADPAALFAPPCRLSQPVLLSLAQQLATDMVHETQLKCRYLEEAIINLNTSNPATRAHLPMVVGEVRKNLMKFLGSYPNHVASRRVTLIIMAADNLLKLCY